LYSSGKSIPQENKTYKEECYMKQGNQADLTHNLKAQPPADSNNELSVVQPENIPKKYLSVY
jgi:hypothetical protein